jgi:hypothetical protein
MEPLMAPQDNARFRLMLKFADDKNSATRRTAANGCNRDAPAGFAAAR